MNRKLLAAAAAALIGIASPSWAGLVTHSFDVVISGSSSLAGTYSGTFSYDSASIVPGGQTTGAVLTDLDFDFFGSFGTLENYDETEANTGSLRFDASGALIEANFGTNCSGTTTCKFDNPPDWVFGWSSNGGNERGFLYIPNIGNEYNGATSVSAAVPEPGTLALAGLALAGLGLSRRRRAS